jgi:hypothetical protein
MQKLLLPLSLLLLVFLSSPRAYSASAPTTTAAELPLALSPAEAPAAAMEASVDKKQSRAARFVQQRFEKKLAKQVKKSPTVMASSLRSALIWGISALILASIAGWLGGLLGLLVGLVALFVLIIALLKFLGWLGTQ